jgi:pimeloyl-ACP methyl ester carboxylesterase
MLSTGEVLVEGGRRLRLARLGQGSPVVLLHGYPDNLQIWCRLAPKLAERFDVIAFDWPGMGYSDPWPGGAAPRQMADRLLGLLDLWRLPAVDLVAMDMGGPPALALAATHPERLRRLTVMNSLVFGDAATSWEIRWLRRLGWNRFLLRHVSRPIFFRVERTSLPRGARLPAALRADLWGAFRRSAVRRFIARMCAGCEEDLAALAGLYPRVVCPTLVLWGACDRHFPPAQAERLKAAVPRSRLEIVAGGEHWMAWHLAEATADRILAFLGTPDCC